jgi:hypothetical protein
VSPGKNPGLLSELHGLFSNISKHTKVMNILATIVRDVYRPIHCRPHGYPFVFSQIVAVWPLRSVVDSTVLLVDSLHRRSAFCTLR